MSVRRRAIAPSVFALAAAVGLLAPVARPALAAEAPSCGAGATSLENGGFETHGLMDGLQAAFPEAEVPPWRTTDIDGQIEIWSSGFLDVPSHEGTAFAEINANSAGTLYQDVLTTPGATMTWSLMHRAREGEDAMRVLIGDAGTADVMTDEGWNFISDDLVDDTTAWGEHSNSYLVPEGQTCTRFAFRAVSAGSGNASVGNFLDAIVFSTSIPAPATPAPSQAATPAPSQAAAPVVTPPPTDALTATSSRADSSPIVLGALGGLVLLGLAAVERARRGGSRGSSRAGDHRE